MAIQQITNVTAYYDADRPFVFEFASSNSSTVNLVYVLQVENPTTLAWETVTGHIKQPIEWGQAKFFIDPSQLCTDFVRWELPQNKNGNLFYGRNHRIKCRLKMTEDVIDANGVLGYDNDENTWLTCYVFYSIDGGITHEETYERSQYTWFYPWHLMWHNNNSADCKFLTDQPIIVNECREDNKFMSFASEFLDLHLEVDITTSNGSWYGYNVCSDPLQKLGVTQFGIGVPQLREYLTATGALSAAVINDPWQRIRFRFVTGLHGSGTTWTQTYQHNYTECGCEDEHIRLWWRNNRNGIDSYTFKGTHRVKIKTKNQLFQKVLGYRRHWTEDPTTVQWRYNTFNQQSSGLNKVNINSVKEMKIQSSWENKERLEWLSHIINSTQVFIEDRSVESMSGVGKLTPVIIKSNSFDTKSFNKSLGKIELDLVYANSRTTSRI